MTQPAPTLDYAYNPRPRRFTRSIVGWVLFIGLAIMLFVLLRTNQAPSIDVPLSEFQLQLQMRNVAQATIQPDEIDGIFVTPPSFAGGNPRFHVTLPQGMGAQWSFVQWVMDSRGQATIGAGNGSNFLMQLILPFLPWLAIFAFVWFFIFRNLRRCAPVQPVEVLPAVRQSQQNQGAST